MTRNTFWKVCDLRKRNSISCQNQTIRGQTTRSSLLSDVFETSSSNTNCSVKKTSWQAENDLDIQRVTQNAIIHELTQQQSRQIQSVVPWFLNAMPVSDLFIFQLVVILQKIKLFELK